MHLSPYAARWGALRRGKAPRPSPPRKARAAGGCPCAAGESPFAPRAAPAPARVRFGASGVPRRGGFVCRGAASASRPSLHTQGAGRLPCISCGIVHEKKPFPRYDRGGGAAAPLVRPPTLKKEADHVHPHSPRLPLSASRHRPTAARSFAGSRWGRTAISCCRDGRAALARQPQDGLLRLTWSAARQGLLDALPGPGRRLRRPLARARALGRRRRA